ncbi:MAG: patatin-like phospholipase family protein [Verrucomicrobia bacterium]|nr:patatin-like phospholipase family protein [Verrucomicrobiota bacterium]
MPLTDHITSDRHSPVSSIEPDKQSVKPLTGTGLCLSGGGYRAMVFHLGAFIRLNEAGLLKKLNRISSVSGGSLAAGVLGMHWKQLNFHNDVATNLMGEVIEPVRKLAGVTIDAESIIGGIFLPGTISDRIVSAYKKHLFGNATLQDLPSDTEGPRFVINATNVQSGALWRFSKPFMADYLVGMVRNPTVPLAVAVAASSAFPPVLSPARLELNHSDFVPDANCPLQKEPFTTNVVLSDGGVYDNLGLETVWKQIKTVLVSDGGGKMQPEAEPKSDWARHAVRVSGIVDNQVRSLRKRQIIESFIDQTDAHDGTYWGIRSHVGDYPVQDPLPCPEDRTMELANTPTRLKRLEPEHQNKLINWGYAICDAAIRSHYKPTPAKPAGFPYPGGV